MTKTILYEENEQEIEIEFERGDWCGPYREAHGISSDGRKWSGAWDERNGVVSILLITPEDYEPSDNELINEP